MDDRTPEQRDADDALTAALERVAVTYDITDPDEVLADYLIVGYARGPQLNTEHGTRVVTLYKDNATGPVSTPYGYLGLAVMLADHQRDNVRKTKPDTD